jgi:hypothetical protein
VSWLRSRVVLAIAAAVGLGLMAYAVFSGQTDEERIALTLTRLEQVIGFESPPNPLTRAAALNRGLSELVTPDVVLEVPERDFVARGKGDLVRLAALATQRMQRFDVDFSLQELQLHGDSADVVVDVITDADHGAEPRPSTRRADLHLVKSDGEWLLASARVRDDDEL